MLLPLLIAVLSIPLFAQENRFEGQIITSVAVQPPGDYLHPEDMARKLEALKPGQPLRMGDVRTTIERLYGSGRFDDIAVDAATEGPGVALRLLVTPARFVRLVSVTGVNSPPSRGQLTNITDLQLGNEFYQPQLIQSRERILELLRSNGLYRANVVPEISAQPYQQVDVTFHLDSGSRAKYSNPEIRGETTKTPEEIVRIARWRRFRGLGPFAKVIETRTQQGIDRIRRYYQKRDHLMARVTLNQMEYLEDGNRVIPSINIEPGPQVTVRAQGAKISKGRLRELVPVFQEQTVDRDLLVEGRREITEYLQAKGYFEAQVEFDQVQEQDREVILYSIFPGSRHKLVYIDIAGNDYFDDETLRERLYTTKASLLRFRHGRYSEDYLRRDVNSIETLYRQNGFRDVRVTTRVEDDYQGKENETAVFFRVEEGPQWFVSALKLEGMSEEVAEKLRPMLQLTEGQPYSELSIATDTDTILSHYYDQGFADARMDVDATPLPDQQRVAVRYLIQTGERRIVRDVLISGLEATQKDLVQSRIRNLSAGAPLALTSMIDSQRRLYDLGIFARVDTAIQNSDGDTENKYVLYRFEEASRWSLNGGIGAQIARIGRSAITTLDTPAGSAGFSPRLSFGVSRNNFAGIGHTLTLQTQWAPGLRQRGLLTYLAPQFKGNDALNLTFTTLFDDSRDVSTFTSRRREASAQLAQRLTKANAVQYRVAWRRVTVSDVAVTPALIPLFAQPVQLGTISSSFIQDRRDDPVDPQRGIWNTLDGAFASNFFGGPRTMFTRLLGRNATYHRLRRDLVLARQTSLGVQLQHSGERIPLPERFFAGGVASHRGFNDNQAGPRDLLTGFPIGGKALMFHNTELRFPLLGDNIGGVFFHDAGNVYSSVNRISFRFNQRGLEDFDYMVHAIGFGIRYRTPVGPVRVDLAYSINSPRFNGLRGTREQLLNPDAFGPNCANLSIGCVQFTEQRISRFQFHFSLGQLF